MGRRWLLFSYLLLTFTIGFANSAFAQNVKDTRTGCIMKGSPNNTTYLVDESTGKRMILSGTDLDKFTEGGQVEVTVTGALAHENGKDVYHIDEIKQTRNICGPIAYNWDAQKSEIGRTRAGFRTGFSLDPELVIIGGQIQLGPIKKSGVWFRPTGEYAFGEVTHLFSINGDFTYFLPFSGVGKNDKWNTYIGGGPAFTILRQSFDGFPGEVSNISESQWKTEFGVSFLVGILQTNGMFLELRAAAFQTPSVSLYVGYVFH